MERVRRSRRDSQRSEFLRPLIYGAGGAVVLSSGLGETGRGIGLTGADGINFHFDSWGYLRGGFVRKWKLILEHRVDFFFLQSGHQVPMDLNL